MPHPPRRRIALGPGAEFDLIRRLVADDAPLHPEVRVGPGDDAAVLEGGWVVTTDLSIEDVHFRRDWLSDVEIGYRAGAAALSDVAAMAATPVAVLVSIAGPRGGGVDLGAVHEGVREVASELGASVIGGDVSASPGPLVVDVVALGRTAWPVLRDGAEPGDDVWVTGRLGAAAAAVRAWEAGREPSAELRAAFARPSPRVREARCLVDHEVVDALIDLSDGLAGDAGHIAAASGVRITLEAARIPIAEAALAALGAPDALEAALHGGEDYELCFVSDPGAVDADEFLDRHGLRLTRVGRVEEGEGVWLEQPDGSVGRLARGGFDHLAGGEQ
jgi:thiamine-monophosphate kinase